MPVFSSKGIGTNLIRTTTVLGRTVRLKTGHGFYRPHKLPSGQVTDLSTSGLTPDQVETGIILDMETFLAGGDTIPKVGVGFTRPLERTVFVNNARVTYRAVESPGGTIDVPTYYAS
jgi:hypothetical protein